MDVFILKVQTNVQPEYYSNYALCVEVKMGVSLRCVNVLVKSSAVAYTLRVYQCCRLYTMSLGLRPHH